ncbi:polyhomeotic-like protein 2 isoform X1 [Takifugu rubripes]|uniref:Polyhomeotic-like protein 3 n=1 Tax=Takifugu rubripes TaxID=31033 RepID=H2SS34_TAKRU|nr:polyhomeotic-like protein 3 isoform X1 [Takifugu rubripes]XP_029686676.1 polyhomeotic-like protein 3 isoform X1 [Takifugu rubripes]
MDGEKQEDSNSRIAAITFPSTSAAVTVATVCPCSASGARAPSSSLSIISSDRQAVQVIQHAIQRPHNMAAQFLQQMYAAQQQHLMLQTAALQQQHQHSPHLQSLATMHQASVRQRQSTSSSSEGLTHQPAGVSIALPASPVTTQLVGRTQNSISSGVSTTISQQAMLLGGRPANCNQAQMYLRTQMLILAPAASVAAVQSELPPVTSCSSASNSSQVQNLVLHQLPGALATAHNVILKPPPPCPALTPAASKISICPPKSSQVTESSSERPQPEVTGSQGITPALSPAQMTLKQQLSCPPGHQGAHRHLILQQDTAASLNHRQHDSISNPPPFSSKIQSSPDTQSQTPRNSPASSSSLTSASSQTPIPAAKVLPQPPPLLAAPQRWSSFPQVQSRPPPPLILPRFPQNSPVTLQRLSQDVRTQVAQKEQEPPATERLVQTLYQNVPPPQTVAIDLKVQPAAHNAKPLSGQTPKGNSLSPSEKKDESPRLSPQISLPFPGSPEHNGAVVDLSLSLSSHAQIRPPAAEEPSQIAASSSNHPPPSPPQLPHILPAAVRCPSHPPSSPRSPFEPITTHVLTHLVEGFVIQEGLEPFPVHPSSLEKQASPSDSQEIATNLASVEEESPLAANQSISSDSEMESNGPAVDVAEHGESVGGVLRCEYCGSRGYACAFLSSKRFCSMTCGRRFSKHIKLLRTGRWGHRATGRRERPPSRVNGVSREHFLKRIYRSGKARKDQEQEDEAPAPMTTRLRKQAERQREKQREKETEEREPEGQITETISISDEGEEDRRPSHWGVEQVFSYINSLPGGEDVAEEFRSQEIDGQALLLLTEDHLVSTMNLKLGPALKLHAYINSLKEA